MHRKNNRRSVEIMFIRYLLWHDQLINGNSVNTINVGEI